MTILRRPDDRLFGDPDHLARRPWAVHASRLLAALVGWALRTMPPAAGTNRA